MRKATFLLITSFLFLVSVVSAQSDFAKWDVYGASSSVYPCMSISAHSKLSEKLKFTYYGMYDEKIAEAYAGLAYSPAKWFTIGLSAGIENNPGVYRIANQLLVGNQKTSLFVLLEKGAGPDNFLYKTTISHFFNKNLNVGIAAWRFHGIGPVIKYYLPILTGDVWIMPAYDPEFKIKRIVAGISIDISPEAIKKPLK